FLGGVALGQLDHVGVVLHAERAGAALRRTDHRAPVARSEVHDEVPGGHLRHVEHPLDHGLRRRYPDYVLAFLPDLGLVVLRVYTGNESSKAYCQERPARKMRWNHVVLLLQERNGGSCLMTIFPQSSKPEADRAVDRRPFVTFSWHSTGCWCCPSLPYHR